MRKRQLAHVQAIRALKGESGDRCGFINFRIQLMKSNSFPEHFFEKNLSNHSNECKIALSVEGIGWSLLQFLLMTTCHFTPFFGLVGAFSVGNFFSLSRSFGPPPPPFLGEMT